MPRPQDPRHKAACLDEKRRREWERMEGTAAALRLAATANGTAVHPCFPTHLHVCDVCTRVCTCEGRRLMSDAFPLSVTTFLFETVLLIESEATI